MELYLYVSAVDAEADPDRAGVDVGVPDEVLDEIPHLLEVGLRHARAGVQNDDQIRLGKAASCTCNTSHSN